MSATSAPTRSWLVGPAADLLLGCGVLYMGVFAAFAVAGPELRSLAPASLPVLLALMLSAPHYGATLLRVYENRADRGKYRLFAVQATLAVVVAFGVGLHSIAVASWLFTIFLVWSPWHYTGQNYGLAVLFLRRRGVPVAPAAKRLLHASFVLSYAVLLLVIYTGGGGDDAARSYGASGHEKIQIQSLGVPEAVGTFGVPLAAFAYLGVTVAAGMALSKRARARDLLPAGLLVVTQGLWFSLPMLVKYTGVGTGVDPFDPDQRVYSFTWIALGHAVQYLWVTSYYARSSPEWHGSAYYLMKAAVAGTALWTLPLVLFSPKGLGAMSGDAGLYLLLSSCINIHHFVLDGAIWKLRDSRIANVLLREPRADPPLRMSRRPWLRQAVWGVAGVGACLAVLQFDYEARLFRARDGADPALASTALDGLAWFGRDSASDRKRIAKTYLDRGDVDHAVAELRRSLALEPDVAGWSELAYLEERRGDLEASLAALEGGLALEPERLGLLHRAGETWLALGRADLAARYLERALAVDPGHAPSRAALARARRVLTASVPLASHGTDPP